MSTDTTPAELAVPRAAFDALHDAADAPMTEYVQRTAAPVVAAELRRLAGFHQAPRIDHEPSEGEAAYLSACDEIARALRDRADELDGGA